MISHPRDQEVLGSFLKEEGKRTFVTVENGEHKILYDEIQIQKIEKIMTLTAENVNLTKLFSKYEENITPIDTQSFETIIA